MKQVEQLKSAGLTALLVHEDKYEKSKIRRILILSFIT